MLRHIPNILTSFRILITPFFVYSFFMQGLTWKLIMFFVFLVSTLTDKLDGHLARKYNWESPLGKFLDPLADKVLLTAAFICLIFVNYIEIWMVIVIVLRDFFVTWLRTFGHKQGQPVKTLEIARWKTGVQTVVLYIALVYMILKSFLAHYGVESNIIQQIDAWNLIWVLMLLATLFTLITGVVYIFKNKQLFSKRQTA
jgi:CDP-diacylglycerol---glycerol-3-phosphate 3-phosphatidyltransferase